MAGSEHMMPASKQVTERSPLKNKNWNPWRALIAYWIFGLCNNYGYVVMLSAAHDIIKDLEDSGGYTNVTDVPTNERGCNYASTGVILLADIIPALVVKFSAPFLPFYVHIRMALCISLAAGGLLLVAFATNEALAITGVVFTSLSSGFGEVSFLQYSSFYNKNVISTWSSGTGGAGILGSLSYAALATLGLKTAMLIMLIIPATMAVAFWLILPPPDADNYQVTLELQEKDANLNQKPMMESVMNKVKLLPGLMKYMIPLGLVYLFEYFINQGLFELIKFDNIFLTTAHQYHWLQVDYQIGVFISRSSVNLIHIRRIWLMCILQLINVIIFTFEAVYFYVPNIWIIFTLVLWEGVLGGAAYVNTFYKISQEVPEDKKQFSMSVTSVADTIGITLAGIAAIPSHNAICSLPKPNRLTF